MSPLTEATSLFRHFIDSWPNIAKAFVGLLLLLPFLIILGLVGILTGQLPNTAHGPILQQLRVNHDLISAGTYYQQRTCVNTSKTPQERERCWLFGKERQ